MTIDAASSLGAATHPTTGKEHRAMESARRTKQPNGNMRTHVGQDQGRVMKPACHSRYKRILQRLSREATASRAVPSRQLTLRRRYK